MFWKINCRALLLALSQFDLGLSDIGVRELLNVQVSGDETFVVQVVVAIEPSISTSYTCVSALFIAIYLCRCVFCCGNISYVITGHKGREGRAFHVLTLAYISAHAWEQMVTHLLFQEPNKWNIYHFHLGNDQNNLDISSCALNLDRLIYIFSNSYAPYVLFWCPEEKISAYNPE